jgi:60 kDa SS-A/Ro ribonucleoprotein
MSMVTVATEPTCEVVGFSSGLGGLQHVGVSARRRLDDNVNEFRRVPMGGTDCALPMVWAREQGRLFDTFIVYTDNETWAGTVHPVEALRQYRRATGIDAKLIVVGMTATSFTIADPMDAGMLDVVGFDASAPRVMADFSAGRL